MDEKGEPMTWEAVQARCRRLCEVKAKGKLNVPEWLHQKWLSDPKGMSKILHDSGFKKDFPNLHQHVSKSTLPKPIYIT